MAELLSHADHIEDVIDALRGPSDRSLNAKISDAHNELGMTLKRADIAASLAVADAVDRLREAIVTAACTPTSTSTCLGWAELVEAGDPHR